MHQGVAPRPLNHDEWEVIHIVLWLCSVKSCRFQILGLACWPRVPLLAAQCELLGVRKSAKRSEVLHVELKFDCRAASSSVTPEDIPEV